jgi:inner membrane protein
VFVFPELLSVTRFRYVVSFGNGHAAGNVGVLSPAEEKVRDFDTYREPPPHFRRHLYSGVYRCDSPYCRAERTGRNAPALGEAMAWARFPVVSIEGLPPLRTTYRVADLRYYWDGKPTLTFVMDLNEKGEQVAARLERGGTARELFERWRNR